MTNPSEALHLWSAKCRRTFAWRQTDRYNDGHNDGEKGDGGQRSRQDMISAALKHQGPASNYVYLRSLRRKCDEDQLLL